MDFFALHQQIRPLVLANVWDAMSVRAAWQAGYSAIGTSSAAIAAMLGYSDGENLSFDELLFIVRRLKAVCSLPLTVDMETGYGRSTGQIIENLLSLAAEGVVGVNLEDSFVRQGQRQLIEAEEFATKLKDLRLGLAKAGVSLFINARTDTILLDVEDALTKTIARGLLYAAHGADGLFVPGLTSRTDIAALVREVPLPLNVMCMADLPTFDELAQLGVARISMGDFVHAKLQRHLEPLLQEILIEKSFRKIFGSC